MVVKGIKKTAQNSNNALTLILWVLLGMIIGGGCLYVFLSILERNKANSQPISQVDVKPVDVKPIVSTQSIQSTQSTVHTVQSIQPPLEVRDRRVDSDPLYPPFQRERVHTMDTFRPIAYLVAEEDNGGRGDVWKLYARERARGGYADFYAVSADRQFDAKVSLTDENVISRPKLRDVYNLPSEVRITHPLFKPNMTYQLVEYDRADWGNMPNYH